MEDEAREDKAQDGIRENGGVEGEDGVIGKNRAMEDREREDEIVEGEPSAAAAKGRRTRPRPQDDTVEGGLRAVDGGMDGVTDESDAEESPRNWRPVTANIIPPQNCPRTKFCSQMQPYFVQ